MDDDALRALQEQSHMLNELTRHPGWAVYVDYLHTVMNADKRAILNGAMSNHEQYQKTAGRLVGIHTAIDAHQTIAEMVHRELVIREEIRRAQEDEQE
jgi:hypothetical protein